MFFVFLNNINDEQLNNNDHRMSVEINLLLMVKKIMEYQLNSRPSKSPQPFVPLSLDKNIADLFTHI